MPWPACQLAEADAPAPVPEAAPAVDAAPAPVAADLAAIDHALWTAFGAGDASPYETRATDDFTQIYAGVEPIIGRDAVMAAVAEQPCALRSFDFEAPTVQTLAPGVAARSYTATQDGDCGGVALPGRVYVTSSYLWQDDAWRMARYQETPIG